MIKIVSFKICPFVQRVTGMLEAKNIPYEIEFISLSDKPRWFLDVSPHGQVPLLITESGRALFESDAIVEYIEEAFAPLQPGLSPEDKAENRAWAYLASKNYLVQCGAMSSRDGDTLAERGAKLGKAFDKIEARLGDSPYFGGSDIGIVDIAWLVLLHRAAIIEQKTGYDFIGERLKLKRWQSTLLAGDFAARTVAPDFEDAFSGFYLSEKTFLGRGCLDAEPAKSGCCVTSCCG